jgi:hypothetical protein
LQSIFGLKERDFIQCAISFLAPLKIADVYSRRRRFRARITRWRANQNGRTLFGFALILLAREDPRSAKLVLILALGAIAFSVVGLAYGRLTPDFIGALISTINPLDLAFACLLCALLVFALFGFANKSSAFAPVLA